MANKTPPLVIPVVIDSTGVDKGLSNVGSRLRRGVGGTGTGGGAGGGFGAGGALAAAALGAGVAAAAGRKTIGAMSARNSYRSNYRAFHGRMAELGLEASGSFTYGATNRRHYSRMFDIATGGFDPSTLEGRLGGINNAHRLISQLSGHRERVRAHFQRSAFRHFRSNLYNRGGDLLTGAGRLGRTLLSTRSLLGTAGIISGAYAASSFAQNFRQNTSDISNLEGSPLYGQMRGVQLRNYKNGPQPTLLQNFLGGGMKVNRNKETYLEKDVKALVETTGGFFNDLGGAYEMARGNGIMAGIGYLYQATINRAAVKGYGL